ncbi:MAG: hypothetical protein CUN56_04160 [Phototrophicales bacterium]|nr:MAG: hypothetical protein CUN56_04160 [Phototrophicales bacterium]RMG76167.1 MAG: HEAT repeat domain-containing protein [Chloroflexota bacterium]
MNFDFSQFDDVYDDEEDTRLEESPSLESVIQALQNLHDTSPVERNIIYGLSGLSHDDCVHLTPTWNQTHAAIRRKLIRSLIHHSEADFRLDYRSFGILCLHDADPHVREAAVELLWEDQSLEVMHSLIQIVKQDDSWDVRATALSGLGRYILAGELEELPQEETRPALQIALDIWQNTQEDINVRRRALEAIANSSHASVPTAIEEAFNSPYQQMQVSAVFAMGRTYDAERWGERVIDLIDHDDPEIRYEAARAAGELSLMDAVPKLAQIIMEDDHEIRIVAIEALGEIGGKTTARILDALLEKAEQEEDDELQEIIEDAIANASLVDRLNDYDF